MSSLQLGVKHVYSQLYKHMPCRLGDGLYMDYSIQLAALLSIGYLSVGMHINIEKGRVLKQQLNYKCKEVHFYEMKMCKSIKTENLKMNYLYALHADFYWLRLGYCKQNVYTEKKVT